MNWKVREGSSLTNTDYFIRKFSEAGLRIQITIEDDSIVDIIVPNGERYEYFRTKDTNLLTALDLMDNKLTEEGLL